MSEQIYPALAKFQELVEKIDLNGEVKLPSYSFKYATLSNILDKIKPAMKEAKLGYTQYVKESSLITKVFSAEDGSCVESVMPIPVGGDPKNVGGSITYFRRYCLTAMLGIAGEEDKDAPEDTQQAKPALTPKMLTQAKERIVTQPDILDSLLSTLTMTGDQIREIVLAEHTAKAQSNG